MKKVIVLILVFLNLSCLDSERIIGHWHIHKVDKITEVNEKSFVAMDVVNDTLARFGVNSCYGSLDGIHKKKEKQLNFPGDCGVFHFKYKFDDRKLILENHLGEQYLGTKCETDCCDKVLDFKSKLKVDLDFISLVGKRKILEPREIPFGGLAENIFVGFANGESKIESRDSLRFQLTNELGTLEDIIPWVEKRKLKYVEERHEYLKYLIFVDKSVSFEMIRRIADEFKQYGISQIYLAFFKSDYQNSTEMFEYVFLDRIILDPEIDYNQIIK